MMTERSAVQAAPGADFTRPYTPSWIDYFTDWVDGLGIRYGAFYVSLGAILIAVQLVIQWDGNAGAVYAFPLVYIVTIAYNLALMHHLDIVAARALARFRPLLSMSESEYNELHYRLTTLPALPALAATALGVGVGIWTLGWVPIPIRINELHFVATPLSTHFNNGLSLVIWGIAGVVVYHTLHQLSIVQQVYNHCPRINLYALRPLYAFSTLSARTAMSIALIVYSWYLCAPHLLNLSSALVGLLVYTGFSMLTFVLPLWGAHRLLVDEKDRRLTENGEWQRAAIAELHRRVEEGSMTDMDNLNKTMASLELEHATLDRISTWPWKQDTLRAVALALFFPVMVWLTQWVLQRVLGT